LWFLSPWLCCGLAVAEETGFIGCGASLSELL
jgi:hypothetical protein